MDSSALLSAILLEPGHENVLEALASGACISTVNLTEVLTRLLDIGFTEETGLKAIDDTDVEAIAFTELHARKASQLRAATRRFGLGIGDRACLALAATRDLPVLTADRIWANLDVSVEVVLCR